MAKQIVKPRSWAEVCAQLVREAKRRRASILKMREQDGLTLQEIAGQLGITHQRVSMMMKKAIEDRERHRAAIQK